MNRKALLIALCMIAAASLVGCGSVITPEPETTRTPVVNSPVETPPPTSAVTPTAPIQPTASTATPTVTPTPIIHVVQEGETLQGIAASYGVSSQALQAANGIENPLLLQVGQELVIPTADEEAGGDSGLLLPTPTPLPFGVRGVSFYETPVGSLWCLGEIVNTTPYTLTNVKVQVTLFDPEGNPLIAGDAFAATDILLPAGESPFDRAPFGILFLSPPANFASHQVEVLRGEYAGALAEDYIPLTLEDVEGAPSGSQFEVSGTVRNPEAERTANSVVVVFTTYDEDGRATGFRQQTVDVGEGLSPGDSAPFQFLLTTHGETPADFSAVAFGRTEATESAE